ncbi:hypothetical protein PR202_gb23278 [Eleusine coracana subsp. coracana]|uniref:Uncharacterized protein n=1 Tax=Eleusine coracana subsp. coracana TaxID=191504 RepID=A0AAV5FJH4_ELECO|nr:hypothetical protein PR202_gb23278 [Eleusine coracana subsp. coracana]
MPRLAYDTGDMPSAATKSGPKSTCLPLAATVRRRGAPAAAAGPTVAVVSTPAHGPAMTQNAAAGPSPMAGFGLPVTPAGGGRGAGGSGLGGRSGGSLGRRAGQIRGRWPDPVRRRSDLQWRRRPTLGFSRRRPWRASRARATRRRGEEGRRREEGRPAGGHGDRDFGQGSVGSDGLIPLSVASESSDSSLENLQNSLKVSVLPPLGSMVITSIAAPFADNLISNGVDTTKVRKICQTIAFMSPAVFMMLSSVDLGLPPWEIVAFLTSGLALNSFALSGLYCTHQDISREYASILLGITNTVGAVPGIVGVALTGYLLDSTHSWSISLFAPSIFFYLTGTAVWLAFASTEPQDFSKSEQES